METYFKNIQNVLFSPNTAFYEIKNNVLSSSQAVFTLVWVNIILYSLKYVFSGSFLNAFFFIFSLIFYIIGILLSWLLLTALFEYIAKIFDKSGKFKILLCLSSYSIIPWIFMTPLQLVKNIGDIGYFFAVILEIFLYFWTIFLYTKSIEAAYDLSFSRSIMLVFLPILGMLFAFSWIIGFFLKMGYIFTV